MPEVGLPAKRAAGGINWRHPLARRLGLFVPLIEATGPGSNVRASYFYDLVSRTPLVGAGGGITVSPSPSRTGSALRFAGAVNADRIFGNPAHVHHPIALPLTVGVKLRNFTAQNGRVPFQKGLLSGQNDWCITIGPSGAADGHLQGTMAQLVSGASVNDYADGNWYVAFIQWAGGPGSFVELLVYDERGQLVERKVSLSSNGAGIDRAGSGVGFGGAFSGGGSAAVDIEWGAMWTRYLPRQQLAEMAASPYGLLLPTVDRRSALFGTVAQLQPPDPSAAIPAIVRRRQSILPPTKPTNTRLILDRQNPLTQGMVFCLPFLEGRDVPGDLANGVAWARGGSPGARWGAHSGMLGYNMLGSINYLTTAGVDGTDFILPRRRCTVLVIRSNTTPASHQMFGPNIGVSGARNIIANLSTTVIQWLFGNNNLQWSNYTTLPMEMWAFVAGPSGASIWLNGVKRASQATAVAERQESPGVQFFINQGTGGGTSTVQQFFALLDAEWTEGQVRSWMADPWQFFKPLPHRTSVSVLQSETTLLPPAAYVSGESRVGDRSYTPVPYHRLERQKPARGAVINWRDPLARDLRSYVPFLELSGSAIAVGTRITDLISRTTALVFGTLNPSGANRPSPPSRTGQGYRNDTGGFGALTFNNDPALQIHDAQGWTIAFKYRCPTIPNVAGSPAFLAKDQPAFRHWRFNGVFTTGQMQFLAGTGAAGNLVTTGIYAGTDAWYTVVGYVGSARPAELAIYDENGLLLERVVGSGLPSGVSLSTTSNINIAQGQTDLCVEWFGVWRGRLSTGQQADLALRPYRFLIPRPTQQAVLKVVTGTPGTISPSGIASGEVVPEPNLVRLALYPTGIVTREVHGTPHIGDVDPSGIASAESFGTARLLAGDINPDGIASAEVVSDPSLLSPPGGAGTITLTTGITTGEGFGTAVITEVSTLHPTGIPSGFDMDLHHVGVAVGTIAPFGIASEEAFSAGEFGQFSGPTVVTPTNPATPLAGTVTTKKLCSPIELIRAEVASGPDGALILPDVYGDFSVGGLRGPCPAVLVTDTSPFVYVAAAHPVKEITNVYVEDVEQTSGFATISAVDLGTGFQVAAIVFSEQPTGQVSWRGKGRMDDSGNLITNPIEQLETLLKHRAGYHTEDFDATTLAEAKAAATTAGWSTSWVFQDDRQVQDWITEIMFNVMGFWRVSGRAQLQLSLDPGTLTFPQSDLIDSIIASRDVVDGDDGVMFTADRQHLVNKLEAFYLYSWSLGQPSSRLTDLNDEISQNAYGELRKSVTLRGHRDSIQVTAWSDILFTRQGFDKRVEGATVEFRVKGSRFAHATIGDLFAFSWPYGPTREAGNPYVNEILRVLTVSQDFSTGGVTTIVAVDTGAYVLSGGTRLLTPLAL